MKPRKPTAKQKPVKAKRYWKTAGGTLLYPTKKQAEYFSGLAAHTVTPVAVIPCDNASVEAMQAQALLAISEIHEGSQAQGVLLARAALTSIGITGGAK